MYHNPIKQNPSVSAKSYSYKTHGCVLLMISFLFLTHAVTNVRYSCCLFNLNAPRPLSFLTFSVLVANPEKLLYTVANPARGLLNREKRTKEKVWQHTPPPHPPDCSFGENK